MTSLGKTTEAVAKVVEVLEPYQSADRVNILRAAMILLGEPGNPVQPTSAAESSDLHVVAEVGTLPTKAQVWAKQNALTADQLQQVFHMDNGAVELIAGDLPGKGNKEKAINAYLLAGITRFLSTGAATFDDKSARALCTAAGCYDASNHGKALKDKGNLFTGSKDAGWVLTAPGLKAAADLVKGLAK